MKKLFLLLFVSCTMSAFAAEQITVAEFLTKADQTTDYRLVGEVQNIKNTTYGNFYLKDETGSIYIFGLLDTEGKSKNFASLGIAEGDIVTLEGKYSLYNSSPQIASAQYISHTKGMWVPVPKTIAEIIALNDGKRYIVTGAVTEIVSEAYGNFYMQDESGETKVLVYGMTKDENDMAIVFANLGLEVGDSVTLSGVYELYGSTPELTSPKYISHKHMGEPAELVTVDFATDFADGWDDWIGKSVKFTNDFYVNSTYLNEVAYMRLRAPEEYGEEGTEEYTKAETHNTWATCTLTGLTYKESARSGTVLRGLEAKVTSANNLQALNTPEIEYNELPTVRPNLGKADLVVCAANIENFFVTLDIGYSGIAKDEEQLEVQTTKIVKALHHMNADIYALCEVEEGPAAATALVDGLNILAGGERYAWIDQGYPTYKAIMICYIYRKDKVKPYGTYMTPYSYNTAMKYREAIQCFEDLESHERFNLSLNHFFAKVSKTDEDRQENMKKLIEQLVTAEKVDPDVLVVGDLNGYTNEESNLLLTRDRKYVDLLMKYDPQGYSYIYGGQVGYLDHAFATSTMAKQVTKALPYHLNADTKYSYEYKYGNTTMYRYADHDPILIGLRLGDKPDPDPDPDPDPIEGLNDVQTVTPQVLKVVMNGHLYIINNGIRYTVTGQRVE